MYNEYKNEDDLRIILPEKIFDSIKKNIIKYYPNECGGVFVGQINNKTAVIEKMMMPKRFKSTPFFFSRIADLINKWLERVFNQSNGNTIYLGEWHSHPNGMPYPSSTDSKSMKKISLNPDVRIKTPILLIVGYNKKEFNERFFIYSRNNLVSYEKEKK